MSNGGSADHLTSLRRAIARIEGCDAVAPLSEPAGDRAPSGRLALGARELDDLLGGGIKPGALYETAPGEVGDQSAAGAFALSLAIRVARVRRGPLVWVIEDFARAETGAPYGPGVWEWGLDPARIVLVRATEARAALWALEEALKCRVCAVVLGELWGSARRYGETAARRLALAARRGGAPCILLHSTAFGGVLPSQGGQARFLVCATPSADSNRPRPEPDTPRFAIRVLRTRLDGGATGFDPTARSLVGWSPTTGLFHTPLGPSNSTAAKIEAEAERFSVGV